ncbi:MAG TPA: type II toxin-antitoxin system VapC family toxin [Kofleriaceae bacterium]|jgi:PIN domain nuclease of toxin-antitoxin system|nr:type II toxin-antitoxin system VapC family toxin [Kofleriaceae bacterium]
MSRYLLDTHAFLWLATDDEKLSPNVRALFADARQELMLSTASIWEMAIKASLGKLTLGTTLAQLVQGGRDRGIRLLALEADHGYRVEHLPFHHRDPFDRILIAQALHEGIPIVSRDESLDPYSVQRVW